MKAGKVRIIGGKWRSRQLMFPAVNALRPSPDAVRETLFNWLAPTITGARCLDLYAGSGALGFEAVSRGAVSAVLIEKNAKVAQALRKNQTLIDTQNQISVTQCAAVQYISTATANFDLVFLDPPFATDELEKACYQLQKHGLIAANGVIYLERASDRKLVYLPETWREIKSAQRGGVKYALYESALHKSDNE